MQHLFRRFSSVVLVDATLVQPVLFHGRSGCITAVLLIADK
jgi:hypothetical protein